VRTTEKTPAKKASDVCLHSRNQQQMFRWGVQARESATSFSRPTPTLAFANGMRARRRAEVIITRPVNSTEDYYEASDKKWKCSWHERQRVIRSSNLSSA
jgi:hypothetical protein